MQKHLHTLLLAALVALPAMAQAQLSCPGTTPIVVSNSDSIDENTTSEYAPANPLYGYSYTEVIIPAERLQGMGTVKALQFKSAQEPVSQNLNDCKVYLGHTSLDQFDLDFIQNATSFVLVYEGNLNYEDTNWHTVVFNRSDFIWNGDSNIVVAVVRNDGVWDQTGSFACYLDSVPRMIYAVDDDNPFVIGQIESGTADWYVPVYRLLGCPASGSSGSCVAVHDLQVVSLEYDKCRISWQDDNNAGYYSIYVNGQLYVQGISSTTILIQHLTPNTSYSFSVVANCSATDQSPSASVSARTPCGPMLLPFVADFETGNFNEAPACWTPINGTVTQKQNSALSFSGDALLDFRGSNYNMIALPAVEGSYQGVVMRFYERSELQHNSCGKFSVGYLTDVTDSTTFHALATYTPHADYVEHELSLSSVPDSAALAFLQHNCRSDYYWYVDRVTVEDEPTCPRVQNVQVVPSAESIAVSWSDTNVSALYYSLTIVDESNDTAYVTTQGTSYTFENLNFLQGYSVSVVSHCSDSDSSNAVTVETTTLNSQSFLLSFDINGTARRGSVSLNTDNATISAEVWYTDSLASEATFFWVVPAGAGVYLDTAADLSYSCLVTPATIAQYLPFNQAVTLRVKAEDPAYYTDYTLTLSTETCVAPRNLRFVPTRTSITASWSDPDTLVTSFLTLISSTPLSVQQAEGYSAMRIVNGHEVTFTNLERESTYYVYVRALCAPNGTQWLSDTVSTLGINICNTIEVAQGTRRENYAPVNGYYGDMNAVHSQSVYPASMLSDLVGVNIDRLKYTVVSGDSQGWGDGNWEVRIGVTSRPNAAQGYVPFDSLTSVYSGNLSASEDSGMTVTFVQPFLYSGGNLVVDFYQAVGSDWNPCFFAGTTLDSATCYSYSGVEISVANFLPSFSYSVCTQATDLCPDVTDIVVDDVEYHSVRLHWQASQADYCVAYRLAVSTNPLDDPNLLDYVEVPADSLSATLTGLNDNTYYTVFVQALCNSLIHPDGVSNWQQAGFRTPHEILYFSVSVNYNSSMGSVTGEGVFVEGTYDTLVATPFEGYRFVQWSTGDTTQTLVIMVTHQFDLTATFELIPAPPVPDTTRYTVSVTVNDPAMGSVTGAGTYDSAAVVTLTAYPATGCQFVHWSTGDADRSISFTLVSDTLIEAIFELIPAPPVPDTTRYTVSVSINDPAMGSVTGAGTYDSGAVVTLTAYPAAGHQFVHWSTGDADRSISFTLVSDTLIEAVFQLIPAPPVPDTTRYTVSVSVNDPAMGSVTGAGTYDSGAVVTLTAYPADGHRFVHWSTGDADRSISFTLVSDTLIEAIFERIVGPQPDTTRYTVTVNVNDTTMGYVTGGGVYDSGAVVSLSAVANPGYRFVQWSNGLTSSSIQFHAVADITLTAVFATEEGIGGVEGLDLTVSVQHRTVTVSGANGHALEVFDLSGRRMAHRAAAADAERIALPHSGVYLLKVEGMPARRIIVF